MRAPTVLALAMNRFPLVLRPQVTGLLVLMGGCAPPGAEDAASAEASSARVVGLDAPVPATCRLSGFEKGGVTSWREVWKGTTDGVPRSLTYESSDGRRNGLVFSEPIPVSGVPTVFVGHATRGADGRVTEDWYAQALDRRGHVVRERTGAHMPYSQWTWDGDTLVGAHFGGGAQDERYTWAFDEDGHLVSSEYDADGRVTSDDWTWDDEGRLERARFVGDGSSSVDVTDWNDAGLPIAADTMNWEGIAGTESWAWDDHGHLTSVTSGGRTTQTFDWTYDDDGSSSVAWTSGSRDYVVDLDAMGRVIRSEDGRGPWTEYTWDEGGTLRRRDEFASDGSIWESVVFDGICPSSLWQDYTDAPPDDGPLPDVPGVRGPMGYAL